MKMTNLLFTTLRNPADSTSSGFALLRRAGYLHERSAWLPLGLRVKRQLEELLGAELEALGGQEFGRQLPASEAERLSVAAGLFGSLLRSHRQLPRMAYQVGMRGGRSVSQLDAFSFAQDRNALSSAIKQQQEIVRQLALTCGLELLAVEAGPGRLDYMLADPAGQHALLACPACGLKSSQEAARFSKPAGQAGELAALQEVETPGVTTIEGLTGFLGITPAETAKAVFLRAEGEGGQVGLAGSKLVFVVLRGDMMLSETKLAHALGADSFRPATEAEIDAANATAGYGSPLGVDRSGVLLIVDDAVPVSPNLVGGANRIGYHTLNMNYGRDFTADLVADVALAEPGAQCPACGESLELLAATRLGGSRQLTPAEALDLGLAFLDSENQEQPVAMASLELDLDELLLAAANANHDEQGLTWPAALAPFPVLLTVVGPPDSLSAAFGRQLHSALQSAGVAALLDDRALRPGVKFNDADLLGIPLRVTLGERGLAAGELEVKWRATAEALTVPVAGAAEAIAALIKRD